ncbi:MAG: RAMP superfamily CRISPR-associated protein [Anaerolineae bacterium]|nr:RAMP superfamily CRISPR-associated protein [Anaerolineae bacterium]
MSDVTLALSYVIEFTTPFHIGSGYGLAGFVDATAIRRGDGNIYVPGASVKGRARYHLTGLLGQRWDHDLTPCLPRAAHQGEALAICTICNLFGSTQVPSLLFFGDATLTAETDLADQVARAAGGRGGLDEHERAALRGRSQVERRSQTSISRRRRVAREELLFVTEIGQAGLRFSGLVEGVLPDRGRTVRLADGTQVPKDLGWLMAALRSIEQLGGRKSRGLGHCTVTVGEVKVGQPDSELTRLSQPAEVLQALRQEVHR